MDILSTVTLKEIIIYILIINIITFLAMLIDKKKAENGKWRIKESTLLTLALIGGSIGEIVGMYSFHHKTKKIRFFMGVPIILILQMIILFLVLKNIK